MSSGRHRMGPTESAGASRPVDVITVPDFCGPDRLRFEMRTLLFLGSWLEHEGASRSWPLRLACIGEPPDSVRRLADVAGALITVHDPMPEGCPRIANKLTAFELAPVSDRFLLLDTDTIVLRDLEPMARSAGDGIAAGQATFNHLPTPVWRQVFECVRVPYPEETGTCWDAQLGLSMQAKSASAWYPAEDMPPYFNSGVLMAPWRLGIGALWEDHYRRIKAAIGNGTIVVHRRGFSDQYSLATAIAALRAHGARVTVLPTEYHTRPPLLLAGVLVWSEVSIFHYTYVLGRHGDSADRMRNLLYGRRWTALHRRLAARLGLRAIRSPVFRLVEQKRLLAYGEFYEHVHRIFQKYVR